MKPLTLWSERRSVARGWRWVAERQVTPESAPQWLAVFQRDEPGTRFLVAARPPTTSR